MKLPWEQTQATVLECRYQFARLNTLTLGIQMQKKFRIGYEYHVDGELFSGTFQSDKAIPQGEILTVRYNPLNPEENSFALQPPVPEMSLLLIVLVAFFVFCLAWYLLHRVHG